MSSTTPDDTTEVGSYFISNYPPFSFWNKDHLPAAMDALQAAPQEMAPIGLYLHIPFCRKRCKFCYFRVYTDKNSKEIERYVSALGREAELYQELPGVRGRPFKFVYFGGGTPSYLSAKQLRGLVDRLRDSVGWDDAEEVTFECEPGTLNRGKLEAIREIGVTRLSLGVENFNDEILEENGRAHRSPECLEAYGWARELAFDQINIDLISGMVGETEENWKDTVRRALELQPECLTIYQMELPFNTIYTQEGVGGTGAVANWETKRRWVDYAFGEFKAAGYSQSSAYTVVRDADTKFVYRDALWEGADMLGTGVASFGHFQGCHMQNVDGIEDYNLLLEEGQLPLGRALPVTPRQLMIREFVLQLKRGKVEVSYFLEKFGLDARNEFRSQLQAHQDAGYLQVENDETIRLTPQGFLVADTLLEPFFEEQHRDARYT